MSNTSSVKGIIKRLIKNPSTAATVSGPSSVAGHETNVHGTIVKIIDTSELNCLSFVGNPLSGTAPLTVNFTVTNKWDNPDEYGIDFSKTACGEDDAGSSSNDSFTFNTAGVYHVYVHQEKDDLIEGYAKCSYITVASPSNPIQDPSFELDRVSWGYPYNKQYCCSSYTSSPTTVGSWGFDWSGICGWAYMRHLTPYSDGGVGNIQCHMNTFSIGVSMNIAAGVSQTFSFTGLSSITFQVRFPSGDVYGLQNTNLNVYVDNTLVQSITPASPDTWISHTIDVSSYSGNHRLRFNASRNFVPYGGTPTVTLYFEIDAITVT